MIIGDKIAELRKEMGLTQEQLGALVGVSSQAVSKWVNGGTPDVELLPEPEGGYKQNLAPIEDYQKLFALLGQENTLKLLFWIAGRRQSSYIFSSAVSKGSGVSEEETDRLLVELKHLGLLCSIEVETEAGSETAYQLRNSEVLLPFLYFARWRMEKSDLYLYTWIQRKKPWLS